MIGRQLVGRPRETSGRAVASNSGSSRARAHRGSRVTSSKRSIPAFVSDRSSLHLQPAPIRIRAQLAASADDRRVQRTGAHERVRRSCLQLAVERLEADCSTRPMRMMASRPSRGRLPCAARPRVSMSIQAKPLCPIADLQVGRFGDDRAVGRPFLDERVGADARVLLVDDRRHDQPPACEAALRRRRAPRRSSRPRRPSCPAIRGRRAGRRESSGANGASMPSTPTVSMCPQNISDRPGASAFEHADDIRPARRDLLDRARRARCAACAPRSPTRSRASPAAPGTSDGFTESIATRSRRRSMAGSSDSGRNYRSVGIGGVRGQSRSEVTAVKRHGSCARDDSTTTVSCTHDLNGAVAVDHRRVVRHRSRCCRTPGARRRRGRARRAASRSARGQPCSASERRADAPSRWRWT